MVVDVIALLILAACFLVASLVRVNMGLLALAAALLVGPLLGGLDTAEVLAGFPTSLFVLLVGISLLFTIASRNGTLDRVIGITMARAGRRRALLPWIGFALAVGISIVGSQFAGLVLVPLAAATAARQRVNPVVMAIAVILGTIAGSFAPTSLYGALASGAAGEFDIAFDGVQLFVAAIVCNALFILAASLIFRGRGDGADDAVENALTERRLEPMQWVTLAAISAFVVVVLAMAVLGLAPDVGTIALTVALVLCLISPSSTADAVRHLDWGTVLLVSGIITYAAMLQTLGTIDLIGELVADVPLLWLGALLLCVLGAAVSAFASTTGILAVLIPLAAPLLAADASIPATGLLIAIAISASLVDTTPFSTAGAVAVTSASEAQRPYVRRSLLRWGLSMIVVGPVVTCSVLVFPWMVIG